jgi:hypothetical protein
MTITANTMDASPRGPNQPRKPTVGGRARAPHRDRDGDHAHEREAEDRVQRELPAELGQCGPEQEGAEEHERRTVEHGAYLLREFVELLRVAPQGQAEHDAGHERSDEAGPAQRACYSVGEGRTGGRDHLPPRGGDQIAPARLRDDPGDQQARGHASQDAVADLLHQQRGGAAPAGDLRFHVGRRDGREQQRHADAVVEPAFDVESLADPLRHARLGDDRLPEGSVGRRQHDREDHGLFDAELPEDRCRRHRAQEEGQRQADGEEPQRHADGAAQLTEVDARRVGEQYERQRRLGQHAHGRAGAREVDPVEHLGPDQQPEGDEQHRRRDRRRGQSVRNCGDAEQRERHQSERPLHSRLQSGARSHRDARRALARRA